MPSKEQIEDLKAGIALAKKKPINVGMCFGKKPAGAIVIFDRKKAPDVLMRQAKKLGETQKVAGGVFELDGPKGKLTCPAKPPSGLAKHFKDLFKSIGVNFELLVLGPDGKVVPEDDEIAGEVTELPGEAGEVEVEEEEEAPAVDPKAVAEKLKALKAEIAEIEGKPAEMMLAIYGKIVEQLKAGAVAEADASADKLEMAIAKIQGAASSGGSSSAGTSSGPTAETAKYGPAVDKMQERVDTLPVGDARDAMTALLAEAKAGLAKGDTSLMAPNLKKVQEGLVLQAAIDKLSPRVAEAASKGLVSDVKTMTLLFNMVADKVPAPDHGKAMTALDRIEKMLAAGGTDKDRQVGADVQPIAKTRLDFGASRGKMLAELNRLQGAIRAECEKVGGLEEVIASLDDLLEPLRAIDERLEDKLDQVVNAPAGKARDAFKAEARTLIAAYRAELAKPFFVEVDDANGFASVAVTKTATEALARVETALAA